MYRGTILYFSDDGRIAHIWCAKAGNPLFRAREADFPELWPTLLVGTNVVFDGKTGNGQWVVSLNLAPDGEV
ncbi:hypothetical protein FIU86_11985 [Roseovarius sp. THAF9]|uniref:hypothetical protein n=1 Tax=Roseovarius sp. THAF9 TaxID=2587847 RepID=UPI001267BCB0|nr:hypothetical protein [Roseovarius sp. THAF9]QFT93563.1 hypothetical protein FIU86_11985 [Roseovarius sp. THAF9]